MDEIATRVPTMWDLVDRLWDDATGRLPAVWTDGRVVPTIRVEEHLQGDHLVVRAELPGIDPERDVDISLAGDRLTITAQRHEGGEAGEQGRRRSEFRYGTFTRTLAVPAGTDASQVSAEYADGILSITAPLPPAAREPQRIAVARPAPAQVEPGTDQPAAGPAPAAGAA